jgi:hypothetical protein
LSDKANSVGRSEALTSELDRATVRIGRLVAGSGLDGLIVDFDGNTRGPLAARSTLTPDQAFIEHAVAHRAPAVLMFENGDPRLPIVVGWIPQDEGGALFAALLAPARRIAPAMPSEARVDGKRVLLEGHDEIVLTCGEASITLKRDGKVILRGAYVETQATGINRIKGGSVKIN